MPFWKLVEAELLKLNEKIAAVVKQWKAFFFIFNSFMQLETTVSEKPCPCKV